MIRAEGWHPAHLEHVAVVAGTLVAGFVSMPLIGLRNAFRRIRRSRCRVMALICRLAFGLAGRKKKWPVCAARVRGQRTRCVIIFGVFRGSGKGI